MEEPNSIYEEERQNFCCQLNDMKQQIKAIHIQYGEEAQKQNEKVIKLYNELEIATGTYNEQKFRSEHQIQELENQLKELEEQQQTKLEKGWFGIIIFRNFFFFFIL